MALLQLTSAIYHHPLDTITETIKSDDWSQSGGGFAAGKVSDGLFATTGDSLSAFGTEAEFQGSGTADHVSVAAFSATSFVVAYRDAADSNHGTAKIGTVTGTSIAYGSESEFLSANGADEISVSVLSATSFVVAYQDSADSNHGTAKIGTVSGTDIVFGAETEFFTDASNAANLTATAALSATKFVVAHRNDSSFGGTFDRGTARVGTVSGTTIAFGTAVDFQDINGGLPDISCAKLSATSVVVSYGDGANGLAGTARIGTVSGTDIAFGSKVVFSVRGSEMFTAVFSATLFALAYRDVNSDNGTARIGTVSGTDISFGAEAEFLSTSPGGAIGVATLSSTLFVVAYQDDSDSSHGTAKVGTVSGTTITFGAEEEFQGSAGGTTFISASALGATSFVVGYTDGADSSHGTARVGGLSSGASLTGTGASYDSVIGSAKLAYTGWMKNPSA